MLPIAVATVLAIFLTTNRGRKFARVLGLSDLRRTRVPREDREFLLDACGGDENEVQERLEAERARYPGFDRAQLYRKAIRSEMRRRHEAGSG